MVIGYGQDIAFHSDQFDEREVSYLIRRLEYLQGDTIAVNFYFSSIPSKGDVISDKSKKRLVALWKGIKAISKLNIIYEPNCFSYDLIDMLDELPTIKTAFIRVGHDEFTNYEDYNCPDQYFHKRIELRVQEKLTYESHFWYEKAPVSESENGLFFSEVDTVILISGGSGYLHPSFGKGMKELEVLKINSYDYKRRDLVLPDAIGEAINLKKIDVSGSGGRLLFPKTFQLNDLEEMIISGFDHIIFENPSKIILPNLKKLYLGLWGKGILDLGYINAPKLKSIKIDAYRADLILGKAPNLEHLILNINQIKSDLSIYLTLKKLYVYNYEKSGLELSDNFINLSLSDSLTIARVNKLPENFGALKTLTYLQLGDCLGNRLPKSFVELPNLTNLLLGNVKKLPSNFKRLEHLQTFSLYNYCDPTILNSISQLKKMKVLRLYLPSLKSLPLNFLAGLDLEELYLVGTKLELSIDDIIELQSIEKLHLMVKKIRGEVEELKKTKNTYFITSQDKEYARRKRVYLKVIRQQFKSPTLDVSYF